MIYVIRDEASGLVKIGFTDGTSMKNRLHDYATHCPGPVTLVRTIDGDRCVELDLHAVLRPYHHRAEWFRVTEEQIEQALATPRLGRLYVNTREAARMIGCDNMTLYQRCLGGRIPGAMSIDTGLVRRWFVPRAWAESTTPADVAAMGGRVGRNVALTPEGVVEIRRRIAAGDRHGDIARDHGVSTSMISRINTGLAWAHVA